MDRFKIATLSAALLFILLLVAPILADKFTYISLIPAAAAVATIYFGSIKYWIDEDLMFKSLFKEFNERFDLLNENLNNIVEDKPLKGEKSSEQIIQDYLNLCAEEYYWYNKGRIPYPVWKSWSAGINSYITSPPIKAYFNGQLPFKSSYYGFLNFVEQKL